MARKKIQLTDNWLHLATGIGSFEIDKEADVTLWINNTDSETAASKRSNGDIDPTDMIFQTQDGEETWMKGEGWNIIIDAETIIA